MNDLDNTALDKTIDCPVTEHDHQVMKRLWKDHIKNKKAFPTDVENARKEE